MASNEIPGGELPDGNLRMNICFDMNNAAERRFVELFRAIPQGFKLRFVRHLLSSNLPNSDDELDLMLAKFIRQHNAVGHRRGRPRTKVVEELRPQAAVSVAAPVASADERQPSGKEGAVRGAVDLHQFAGLAGVSRQS